MINTTGSYILGTRKLAVLDVAFVGDALADQADIHSAQEMSTRAVLYDRAQIRAALASYDPASSAYVDLETGTVMFVNETEPSPTAEQLRDAVMAPYGYRYRYIPGGNPGAGDAAVTARLENEGL